MYKNRTRKTTINRDEVKRLKTEGLSTYKIADAMKQAATELEVDMDWGGDWKSFPDGPHYQLAWGTYPK